MKIQTLLLSCALVFLTGCVGLTSKREPLDPKISEAAEVDWDRIVGAVNDILKPRLVQGKAQNRSEVVTGQELWDLSLRQELALEASEGDKIRGKTYIKTVAEKGKQLDRLAKCGSWGWLCRRKARAAPAK